MSSANEICHLVDHRFLLFIYGVFFFSWNMFSRGVSFASLLRWCVLSRLRTDGWGWGVGGGEGGGEEGAAFLTPVVVMPSQYNLVAAITRGGCPRQMSFGADGSLLWWLPFDGGEGGWGWGQKGG